MGKPMSEYEAGKLRSERDAALRKLEIAKGMIAKLFAYLGPEKFVDAVGAASEAQPPGASQ